MKTWLKGILIIIPALILTSCQTKVLFEETTNLPVTGWTQNKLVSFSFPVENTSDHFNISLIVRNDARYKYSNLFLFVKTTAPGGQGIRDTVEIRLADQTGKWFGKGIGGKYTLEVPFKEQVIFPQPGRYSIEIEHGMREEDLEFITDIGLRILKNK